MASRLGAARWAAVAYALLVPGIGWAQDPAAALSIAGQQVDAVAAEVGSIEKLVAAKGPSTRSAEKRIAEATLLMGVKDYERAADVLHQVLELYPDHPTATGDATRLLGETYFQSGQYLAARRMFQQVVSRADDRRFVGYYPHAVVRLVDVALRTGDVEPLRELFGRIDERTAASDSTGALAYARGRGLYALGASTAAADILATVPASSPYAHQARYLLGVVQVRLAVPAAPASATEPTAAVSLPGTDAPAEPAPPAPKDRYFKALEAFRDVTRLPPDTTDHRHVIALAWLAIGRLHYESDQWLAAVEAYNHIDRNSPEFPVMLYELAWVYVRLGDVVRARRALEVLSVAAPSHPDIADASLLRADLMLRAGQFDRSLKIYENIRGAYDTMRERVDAFLRSTTTPKAYFDALGEEQLELFESDSALPAIALRWAREGEDGATAFAVVEDIAICRQLIKQSNEMIDRLNAVLASPNRVRAMPELLVAAEKGLSLLNTVALARLRLGGALDQIRDTEDLPAPLRASRARRQELEPRLSLVPVTASDFATRETDAKRQWNSASQGLQRLELEINTLQATVNGLRRMIQDGPQAGVVRDPAQLQGVLQELAGQQRNIADFRAQLEELRRMTDAGKVQVGFGDKRFVEDATTRKAYREALADEVARSARGEGGVDLQTFAGQASPLLRKADETDGRIERVLAELDRAVAGRADELRRVVAQETASLVGYSLRLEQLDQEATAVVGGVALRNFANVRDRLKNIVLRADVGVTEQAWEVREEQVTRVRRLRIEKARSERMLQEELNEVLDDSGDPEE